MSYHMDSQASRSAKRPRSSSEEEPRRRRTPRACESCRRRKIRCNGDEECAGCQSSGLMCVYRDADGGRLVKEHMAQFDARLQRMEGVLADFVTRMEVMGEARREQPDALPSNHDPPEPCHDPPLSHHDPPPTPGPPTPQSFAPGETEPSTDRPRPPSTAPHRLYADGYGELHPDEWGQLRYVGMSSTMSVVDICVPFRQHIHQGLARKGYDDHNNFLGPALAVAAAVTQHASEAEAAAVASAGGSAATTPESARLFVYGQLPPPPLVRLLLDSFYNRLFHLLPVVTRADAEADMAALDGQPDRTVRQSAFLPVLYGLLAVGALNLRPDEYPSDAATAALLAPWRAADLGAGFFALASAGPPASGHAGGRPRARYPDRNLHAVVAQVLQAAYLAAVGSQAEAWIVIGQAARLGQDLGLHRSAAQLGFARAAQERRRFAWWCIYSLDRALSAALGRPLAIRDADCDMELPAGDAAAGFSAILNLRRILGDIVTTVASVRTVKASRHVSRVRTLHALVRGLAGELQTWAAAEVPARIKSATEGAAAVDKYVALSGHFGALLLLYRFFIANPHRPSPLPANEALVQCARAATNCIRITDTMVTCMPVCPDLVLHVQHVFTSSVVLLQCIRRADDASFIQTALTDVERATRCLRRLQRHWAGATRLLAQVEEYVEFTLRFIENGVAGDCAFYHEQSDFTGLEIRDSSGRFPSEWAQLAFKRLPMAPRRTRRERAATNAVAAEAADVSSAPASSASTDPLFRFPLPQQSPDPPPVTAPPDPVRPSPSPAPPTAAGTDDDSAMRAWGAAAGQDVLDTFWIGDLEERFLDMSETIWVP